MARIIVEEHEHVTAAGDQSRLVATLGWLTDHVLVALVFLFPLFYFPGLRDTLEMPKQLLLLGLMTVAGILWIVRVFLSRTLTLRRSFIFFPVILYLFGLGIATMTSLDRYVSFFGGSFNEYTSFASLVGFVLLLFFVVSSGRDFTLVRRLLSAFLIAALLLGLGALLKIFGVSLPWLPAARGWNTVGSVFALGIFSAALVVLASGLSLFDPRGHAAFLPNRSGTFVRILALVVGVLHLVVLVVLDWWIAWAVLLVGIGLLLLFVFVYAHTFRNLAHLLLPLVAFVVALILLFVRTPIRTNLPIEIGPGQGASWQVATEVLREHPVLGSGPATYLFDYAKYRPAALSQTVLWNVRFDRAKSFVLTLLPTAGLVGAILWVLLVGIVVGLAVQSFLREREPTAWLLTTTMFFPWAALLVARFLYSSNMTLEFFFWLLTALLVVGASRRLGAFTFAASPRALLGTSFGAVMFAVLVVIVLVLGVARTSAWAALGRAVAANARGDFDTTREELVRAVDRDPRTDVFSRNLAQLRLVEAARATSNNELQTTLNAAVTMARRGAAASPANAENWAMLGSIYREMALVVTNAAELALDAFGKTRELEPRNPVYPTEMGRVEIVLADRARGEAQSKDEEVRREAEARIAEHLSNAEQLFGEAIELKQDYAPAHFFMAVVLDREGRLKEAITKMESVVRFNPQDVGVAFQLGILYLKDNNSAKAEAEFKRALQLSPNYANAHWYLAALYETQGKLADAIREVEAVLATNPDNQAVKDRLTKLRGGTATTPPLPAPVEERESELSPGE